MILPTCTRATDCRHQGAPAAMAKRLAHLHLDGQLAELQCTAATISNTSARRQHLATWLPIRPSRIPPQRFRSCTNRTPPPWHQHAHASQRSGDSITPTETRQAEQANVWQIQLMVCNSVVLTTDIVTLHRPRCWLGVPKSATGDHGSAPGR